MSSLLDYIVGSTSRSLVILAGAAGCVLLIACANVGGLLTARAFARRKEISLRTALGASRSRIARQLLTESVMLSLLGGIAGVAVAEYAIPALLSLTTLPRSTDIALDTRMFVVTLIASLGAGLGAGFCGLVCGFWGCAPGGNGMGKGNVDGMMNGGSGSRVVPLGGGAAVLLGAGFAGVVAAGLGLLIGGCAAGGWGAGGWVAFPCDCPGSAGTTVAGGGSGASGIVSAR